MRENVYDKGEKYIRDRAQIGRSEDIETETRKLPFIWLWTLIFSVHAGSGVPLGPAQSQQSAGGTTRRSLGELTWR